MKKETSYFVKQLSKRLTNPFTRASSHTKYTDKAYLKANTYI